MSDMQCPYCGADQEVCHNDSHGYSNLSDLDAEIARQAELSNTNSGAAPKLVPLTKSQMKALIASVPEPSDTEVQDLGTEMQALGVWIVRCMRALEAAHGITED